MRKCDSYLLTTQRRLIAAAISACFASAPVWGNPTGAQVVNGSASISQTGKLLTVTNSNGAIINWNTFSIGAGETTRFNQASASSSVLNRVLANNPSVLLGTLSSNGRVWLVNPSGIMVGQGARIDVGGFIASTLNVRNEDFLAGRLNFGATPNAGKIENSGQITTPSGGSVYLIAPAVTNNGVINAANGEVLLAAGQTVQLLDTGTPGVKVEITGTEGSATNLGQIVSEAGRIGLAGVLVKNSGQLNASSLVKEGGRIFLKASQDAYVDGAGRIVTTGKKGGSIEVLGSRVAVMDQAQLDASGDSGGGSVLVGGDYQGKNAAIQNSQITYFGPDAAIKADAVDKGDGGKVIVWADDTTHAYGNISVRGGPNGGNGGFVETSGHRYLDVNRAPDLSAPRGEGGEWLLDPDDVAISSATGSNITGIPTFAPAAAGSSLLQDMVLRSALQYGGTVTVDTSSSGSGAGNILVAGSQDGNAANLTLINVGAGPSYGGTLNLKAHNNITVNSSISSQGYSLAMNLIADQDNNGTGSITIGPGAQLISNNNSISLTAAQDISIGANATISTGSTAYGGEGYADLTAKVSNATGTFTLGAGATLQASQNVNISAPAGIALGSGSLVKATIQSAATYVPPTSTISLTASSGDISLQGSLQSNRMNDNATVGAVLNAGGKIITPSGGSFTAYGTTGALNVQTLGSTMWQIDGSVNLLGTIQLSGASMSGAGSMAVGGSYPGLSAATLTNVTAPTTALVIGGAGYPSTVSVANGNAIFSDITFGSGGSLGSISNGTLTVNSSSGLSVPASVTYSGNVGYSVPNGMLSLSGPIDTTGTISLAGQSVSLNYGGTALNTTNAIEIKSDALTLGSTSVLYGGSIGVMPLSNATPMQIIGTGTTTTCTLGSLCIAGGVLPNLRASGTLSLGNASYGGTTTLYGGIGSADVYGNSLVLSGGTVELAQGSRIGSCSINPCMPLNSSSIVPFNHDLTVSSSGAVTLTGSRIYLADNRNLKVQADSDANNVGTLTLNNSFVQVGTTQNNTGATVLIGENIRLNANSTDWAMVRALGNGNQTITATNEIAVTAYGGKAAGFMVESGNQTISANNITLQGSPVSATPAPDGGFASIAMRGGINGGGGLAGVGSGTQTINLTEYGGLGGSLSLTGGGTGSSDSFNYASISQGNTGGTQVINIYGGGAITLKGGAGSGTGDTSANCVVTGGPGGCSQNYAFINNSGSGGQAINFLDGAGSIALFGGSGGTRNYAVIGNYAGNQVIGSSTYSPSIHIQGGTSGGYVSQGISLANNAGIFLKSPGAQSVYASSIALLGGSGGNGNASRISTDSVGGSQTVYAGSIALAGGYGGNANPAEIYTNGDQSINAKAGGISLTGGSGAYYGGYAVIGHGAGSGNQTINVYGGTVALSGGSATGTTTGDPGLVPTVCASDPSCFSQSITGAYAGIFSNIGTQTLAFRSPGGILSITGGSGGSRNSAWISNHGAGGQTISGAPAVALTGGSSGGNGYVSTDGYRHLTNGASFFSPTSAQSLTAASLALNGGATQANAWVIGKGQTINVAGATTLRASTTASFGGSAGIRSTGEQSLTTGTLALYGGTAAAGFDSYAGIEHATAGNQSITLTGSNAAVSLNGGSGSGLGSTNLPNACDAGGVIYCDSTLRTSNNGAYINNAYGSQTIDFQYGGSLSLTGGSNGIFNFAQINNTSAAGQQKIYSSSAGANYPTITLTGGASGGAVATYGGNLALDAAGTPIYLRNGAWIQSPNSTSTTRQTINAAAITLTGGGESATYGGARIFAPYQDIASSASITLTGGAGANTTLTGLTSSLMGNNSGFADILLSAQGDLTLTGGSGQNSGVLLGSHQFGASVVVKTGGNITAASGIGSGATIGSQSQVGSGTVNLTANGSGGISLTDARLFGGSSVSMSAPSGDITLVGAQRGTFITSGGSMALAANNIKLSGGNAGVILSALTDQAVSARSGIVLQAGVANNTGPSGTFGTIGTAGTGGGSAGASVVLQSGGTQSLSAHSIVLQAGATGHDNSAVVQAHGGQAITIAGSAGTLSLSGGGDSSTSVYGGLGSYNNFAEINHGTWASPNVYAGTGDQLITVNGGGSVQLTAGGGTGSSGYFGSDCVSAGFSIATCSGGINDGAIRNYVGAQTLNFGSGGSIAITGGSAGRDNSAGIENSSSAPQTISGLPNIAMYGGASGGSYAGSSGGKDFTLSNEASIHADSGAQAIGAGTIYISGGGAAYGGAGLSALTQTISTTGDLILSGGSTAPAGSVLTSPAYIGQEQAGALALTVGGSLLATGNGSGVLIGTYRGATNTSISANGDVSLVTGAVPGSVHIGSYFGLGGSLAMKSVGGSISLADAEIGTGSTGSSTTSLNAAGAITQTAGGKIGADQLNVASSTGSIDLRGQNQAANVAASGYAGVSYYSDAQTTHISAVASNGNILVQYDPLHGSGGNMALGTLDASGGSVTVNARGAITDDNATETVNITAASANLSSVNGGASGALAISTDTAVTGGLTATVSSGAAYGGIRIANYGGQPSSLALSDNAAAGAKVGFFNSGDITNTTNYSLKTANGGDLALLSGGNLTYTDGVVSTPSGTISLAAVGSITLGTLSAPGGSVAVNAGGAIVDNNGTGTVNISAGTASLTSAKGGASGALAISADTTVTGGLTATVSSGAAYGGIRVANYGGQPSGLALTDNAAAGAKVGFFNSGDITNTTSYSLKTVYGGDLALQSGGNLTYTGGGLATPSGSALVGAAGTLGVTGALSTPANVDLSLSAGSAVNVSGSVNTGAAGTIAITSPAVSISGTLSSGDDVGVIASTLDLASGAVVTAGHDVIVKADGITAQNSTVSAAHDISLVLASDARLNNGSRLTAENDIWLALNGVSSTLYLNDVAGLKPSYLWAKAPSTIHLAYAGRTSGGMVVDGVAVSALDLISIAGGSGLFFDAGMAPAVPGSGLIVVGMASAPITSEVVTAAITNTTNSAVISTVVSSTTTTGTTATTAATTIASLLPLAPPPPSGSTSLGMLSTQQTIGGTAGTFGGTPTASTETSQPTGGATASNGDKAGAGAKPADDKSADAKKDEKKDEKKEDKKDDKKEASDKKEDKPAAKKVATCS